MLFRSVCQFGEDAKGNAAVVDANSLNYAAGLLYIDPYAGALALLCSLLPCSCAICFLSVFRSVHWIALHVPKESQFFWLSLIVFFDVSHLSVSSWCVFCLLDTPQIHASTSDIVSRRTDGQCRWQDQHVCCSPQELSMCDFLCIATCAHVM